MAWLNNILSHVSPKYTLFVNIHKIMCCFDLELSLASEEKKYMGEDHKVSAIDLNNSYFYLQICLK